jgi:hypothetical protein
VYHTTAPFRYIHAQIGTAAAYVTLRGGIALFHRMRRNFLRQLMEDVSTALDRLGATYWLDFGALLGVYRWEVVCRRAPRMALHMRMRENAWGLARWH